MSLFREPIVHFLIAGLVLFGLFAGWTGGSDSLRGDDPYRIVVERSALLSFVQAKTKIADESEALRAFMVLDEQSRKAWVDRYVREEVLVREARALGLDREDSIIRRRLAQKIEFLTLGLLEKELRFDPGEIDGFYREHGEDYRIPTTVTFTHVFIREPDDAGRHRAESLRVTLNHQGAGFRDAPALGDRFLYNRNYVDRTIEEVRSHFGEEFTRRLESIDPLAATWTGPIRSSHGWHLVLLTRRAASRIPDAEEVAGLVRDDAMRAKRETVLENAIDALVAKYQIELEMGAED
jgi:hypothetical protein